MNKSVCIPFKATTTKLDVQKRIEENLLQTMADVSCALWLFLLCISALAVLAYLSDYVSLISVVISLAAFRISYAYNRNTEEIIFRKMKKDLEFIDHINNTTERIQQAFIK